MNAQFNFFGIKAVIESDDEKFISVVQDNLNYFFTEANQERDENHKTDLQIRFYKNRIFDTVALDKYTVIGKDVFLKDNRFVCLLGRHAVSINYNRDNFTVEVLSIPAGHPYHPLLHL